MLRLGRAPDLALAVLWADQLRQAGFAVHLNRLYLAGAAGDLPPGECAPELWLADPAQAVGARALLAQLQSPPQHRWTCACGEVVEGGFDSCWACGRVRPA